jgi:hypothetical protein
LRRLTTLFSLTFLCALGAREAWAQGGPPMITDDPGTPGNGRWENNLAIAFEHRSNEWLIDAPAIDLNYGWGDHIQLTLQTSLALLKRSDHGLIGGWGRTEAAMKWRFLDEERSGFDMSMFPRVIFNVLQSSVRRGLSQDGTRFQLPFQLAKKFGPIDMDFELGALASTVDRSEFLYGVVGGTEVTKTTTVMAELHGTSRTNFTRDSLTLNFGWRHQINEHAIWIGSFGHELRAPAQDALALIGYCGVQLLY